MNANSAFTIGKTHDICQDYAVAGLLRDDAPFVAVSDGCSSSPDTDIGARLLVKSAEALLRSSERLLKEEMQGLHEQAARLALQQARQLKLNPRCVDATLLTIHVRQGEFIAACYGDGVIALQRRDGALEVYSISFAAGYPLYPSYAHQNERLRSFEAQSGNVKEITRYRWQRDDETLRLEEREISRAAIEVITGSAAEYEFVAVLTDGIHSFAEVMATETSRQIATVGCHQVIRELLAFRTTQGAFVQRRLNRFLSECQKRHWQHHDDLGLGAVCLQHSGHGSLTTDYEVLPSGQG